MSEPFRVGFCVSGRGRLFRAAASHAQQLGIVPVTLIGESKSAADLDEFCDARGIAFHRLEPKDRAVFDRDLTRICIEGQLDLLCLTFDRILSSDLVAHYRRRILNVHPALLPAFKGMKALKQAVDLGTCYTGATIHEVTDDLDAGAIIAQCIMGVRRQDTPDSLGRRLFGPLRLMFLQVLAWYATGRVIKDERGRTWVKDAVYGELPISPAVEDGFPD